MIQLIAKPEFVFWSGYSHPFHAILSEIFKEYPFTFSRPIGRWKKAKENGAWIVFRMRLLISSIPDVEIEVFQDVKEAFPDFNLRFKRHVYTETVTTQSPILSYFKHENKYVFLSPQDSAFAEKINLSVASRAQKLGFDYQGIEIEPIETKPVIFKFKEKASYTAYSGTYKLKGNGRDINFVLWTGFSKKTQQGLGLITKPPS